MSSATNQTTSLPPGFRFFPTDEELILHYLQKRVAGKPCAVSIIAEVDIYKFDPWDLPAMSSFGEKEWYFFSPRDRKYPNGVRPNRAAATGYWKATGTDKAIVTSKGKENIGVKKALVFYKGRPPKGIKTDWIMHEYRLAGAHKNNNGYRPKLRDSSMRLDDWVLCRIYKKSSHHSSPVDSELREDSVVEDHVFMPTPRSSAATQLEINNNTSSTFLNLPKSCSLTELFQAVDCSAISRLLDTPPDMLCHENPTAAMPNPTFLQPLLSCDDDGSNYSNENNYLVQSTPPRAADQFPSFAPESSCLKRLQPAAGDCGYGDSDLQRPAKKPVDHQARFLTNFISNKFEGTQLNYMNHPLIFNH